MPSRPEEVPAAGEESNSSTLCTCWMKVKAATVTLVTIAVTAIQLAIIFGLYYGNDNQWPGDPAQCAIKEDATCFCEASRLEEGAMIAQPANAWSNFAYIAAAILLAILVDYRHYYLQCGEDDHYSGNENLLLKEAPIVSSAFYCILVTTVGCGSTAAHGTLTQWGEYYDVFAMYLYALFLLIYVIASKFYYHYYMQGMKGLAARDISQTARAATKLVFVIKMALVAYVLSFSVFVVVGLTIPGSITEGFAVLAGAAAAVELVSFCCFRERRKVQIWWFVAGTGSMLLALIIWVLSAEEGSPLCLDEEHWFQGHAVWHVFSAFTTVLLYLYSLSEHNDVTSWPSEHGRSRRSSLLASFSQLVTNRSANDSGRRGAQCAKKPHLLLRATFRLSKDDAPAVEEEASYVDGDAEKGPEEAPSHVHPV